jgi:DNA-directed RNA polymerase subunit RPC12/RpoP
VDEVGEFHGKETRVFWVGECTHVNVVPVALLSPELDRETTGVPCRVCGSRLSTDSRETSGR